MGTYALSSMIKFLALEYVVTLMVCGAAEIIQEAQRCKSGTEEHEGKSWGSCSCKISTRAPAFMQKQKIWENNR